MMLIYFSINLVQLFFFLIIFKKTLFYVMFKWLSSRNRYFETYFQDFKQCKKGSLALYLSLFKKTMIFLEE